MARCITYQHTQHIMLSQDDLLINKQVLLKAFDSKVLMR